MFSAAIRHQLTVPRYRLSHSGAWPFRAPVLLRGTLCQIVSVIQHSVPTVLNCEWVWFNASPNTMCRSFRRRLGNDWKQTYLQLLKHTQRIIYSSWFCAIVDPQLGLTNGFALAGQWICKKIEILFCFFLFAWLLSFFFPMNKDI